MGMAASQARFLGLTARKTNVEYEGQQINQQRTTLANQSANYYNQLLGMSVPVPPSVADYTKTVYSFNDGALTNTITSLMAEGNGNYRVSYLSSWTDDFAIASGGCTSIVNASNNAYYVGADKLKELGETFELAQVALSRPCGALSQCADCASAHIVCNAHEKIHILRPSPSLAYPAGNAGHP